MRWIASPARDLLSTKPCLPSRMLVAYPPDRLYRYSFPITDTEGQLDDAIARRCADLPVEIQDAIRLLRPYRSGNEALWIVNHLRNINEHRFLVGAAVITGPIFGSGSLEGVELFSPPRWDPTENELAIARYPIDHQSHYDLHFPVAIAIGEIMPSVVEPAALTLDRMTKACRQAVSDLFLCASSIGLGLPDA